MVNESYKRVPVKIRENFGHATLHDMHSRTACEATITCVKASSTPSVQQCPLHAQMLVKGAYDVGGIVLADALLCLAGYVHVEIGIVEEAPG